MESLQGNDEASGGAVSVSNHEAFVELVVSSLGGDHGEVIGIDERDHEGGHGLTAVVFRIGKDDEVVCKEFGLC